MSDSLLFIYDGSFEGLLSAIFDAYSLKRFPARLCLEKEAPPLDPTRRHLVNSTEEKSGRVFRGLRKHLAPPTLRKFLLLWLAEEADGADLLFRLLRKVFDGARRQGGFRDNDLADPDLLALEKTALRVRRETDRLAGFLRFQKTRQGIYVAVMAPRHNILPLLTRHFTERLGAQPWIIYDAGRGYGFLRREEEFRQIFMEERYLRNGGLNPELLAEEEKLLQELWRGYYASTAIPERLNPSLQRRLLPKRFWKYMTEKQTPWEHGSVLSSFDT
jgi:probable DNA metabolism protein